MQIFSATDIGTKRNSNQDAYKNEFLSSNAAFSVVCDGMGGANAGNVASTTAVSVISEYIKRSFVPDMNPISIKNMLVSAIDTANSEIYKMSECEYEYNGMGTTAVAALVINSTAYIAHVGDSRAYLIGKNDVVQLTKDHSMIQKLIESGHLTTEEAKNHPKRNVITRAIGISDTVDCDYTEVEFENSKLILCTDGISNAVSKDDILKIVNNYELEAVPKILVEFANEADSGDNVTVTAIALA